MMATHRSNTAESHPRQRAFTLIELLIVVAIIAILAAIAVPNFLEAQTRSKISRVKSDMRTISVAINSYVVDNNKQPYQDGTYVWVGDGLFHHQTLALTTPIAYLSSLPTQVFAIDAIDIINWSNVLNPGQRPAGSPKLGYAYDTNNRAPSYGGNVLQYYWALAAFGNSGIVTWSLAGIGPTSKWNMVNYPAGTAADPSGGTYDPTNGTVSAGNFWLCEKGFANK